MRARGRNNFFSSYGISEVNSGPPRCLLGRYRWRWGGHSSPRGPLYVFQRISGVHGITGCPQTPIRAHVL